MRLRHFTCEHQINKLSFLNSLCGKIFPLNKKHFLCCVKSFFKKPKRSIFIPSFGSRGFSLENILLIAGLSHLDDGCINQRLEADEARIPVISCSAVHRASKTVG